MQHDRGQASLRRRDLLTAALASTPAAAQAATDTASQAASGTPSTSAENGPSSDAIRALLSERVEIGRQSLGYVAAVAGSEGPRLIICGRSDAENRRALDGDTVFEIGSITKVFTALLLADMAQRGEVALADPVAKYLPPEGRPREFAGTPISLLDLATYTSGLPRMPGNFHPRDPANPYADYAVPQLYSFLSSMPPQHLPGSHYEYANLGFGLLGHALALRAGRSYEELVRARICGSLGLDDTRITLTPGMRQRLAPGHNGELRRVPGWDFAALAGAGALRSTANDLLRFLDACQGRRATPLTAALASLLDVRRRTGIGIDVAAGWFVQMGHNDELAWKDGGTGGYASFIGYSTRTRVGAVLLSNTAVFSTTQLGLHLLNPAFPLPTMRRQVEIDAAALDAYAGRYALTPQFVLTVTPRDGRLMVQATGQDEFEVYPESGTRFFYRIIDAQITFEREADGAVPALVLHQNGRDRRGVRLP